MAEFDEHVDSYHDQVNASVAFAGREVDFYARRKAAVLVDLVTRLRGRPDTLDVLDVGCGLGVTDAHLADRFATLHGVDVAADAVAEATTRNPGVDYRTYDGVRLPYGEGELDVAFAICVLHHIDVQRRHDFCAELARVVRPGGLVAVFEHNPWNPLTRVAVSRCEFDRGVELLSRGSVAELLDGAGLDVVEQRFMLFLPIDGAWADRVDRTLRQVPLGAQHYVVGRRR